jgi:hypothetical protein
MNTIPTFDQRPSAGLAWQQSIHPKMPKRRLVSGYSDLQGSSGVGTRDLDLSGELKFRGYPHPAGPGGQARLSRRPHRRFRSLRLRCADLPAGSPGSNGGRALSSKPLRKR